MSDRLERLINLVIALREANPPMTAAEVRARVAGYGQDDHEAFRRMFERDKADLRALGVPLETTALDAWDDLVGYRIPAERYDLPEVAFEPDELAALALAVQVTGVGDQGVRGLRKLAVTTGERLQAGASRVEVDLSAPHRDALLEAVISRTPVRFPYRPPGRPQEVRTVDPHGLVHRAGRWYLVARDHARDDRRAFRLDRISGGVSVVGGAGAFAPPPGAGVDDVIPAPPPGSPPAARVRAAPEVAWTVARRAGGAGEAAPGPDGRTWTAFTVVTGDPERFVRWALEHGPDLVVDEPAALRAEVAARLEAAVAARRAP